MPREGFELDLLRSAALKGMSPAALARGLGLLPLSGVESACVDALAYIAYALPPSSHLPMTYSVIALMSMTAVNA